MKTFTKGLISTFVTTAIVSGIVYAATINSVTTQTIGNGDTMGVGWFQTVNDHVNSASGASSIDVYQCPNAKTPGANPGGGAWASYGCTGQMSSMSTCTNIEYPWQETRNCSYLGNLHANNVSVGTSSSGIGVGQTWQNVTLSRSAGIWYTNNTGKPISVAIYYYDIPAVGDGAFTVSPDGGVTSMQLSYFESNHIHASFDHIIPHGWSYKFSGTAGTWHELR